MDEVKKEESHMTSPAAFVEGGIQEACDDACSICLEAFCDSDPSTVTSCKHEFHLQCVLEWCQRSSNCPMCWQHITLKDPTSQELLEAVERERSIRLTPPRNTTTIFRHPTLGDFELQHLPVGVDDPELEERIIQHLAAAAAMGRNHRAARGEGLRSHSSANALPQFLLLSANPNEASSGRNSSFFAPSEVETETHATGTNSSVSITNIGVEDQQNLSPSVQHNIISESGSRSQPIHITHRGVSNDNRGNVANQDSAGPSEFQSPSESWKSRFSSLSMKYKDSISRNTRGWKEKLFSRSSSMAEIGSEVKRELNAGIAKVSRMMENLETRDNRRAGHADNAVNSASTTERSGSDNHAETSHEAPLDGNRAPNSTTPSSVSS